jgi:hypothetical protein
VCTAPAHRMCQMLSIVPHFGMLTQIRCQVLTSIAPAHRMSQMVFVVFTWWDASLHPDEDQVLSTTAPVRKMCQVLFIASHFGNYIHVFMSCVAGMLQVCIVHCTP